MIKTGLIAFLFTAFLFQAKAMEALPERGIYRSNDDTLKRDKLKFVILCFNLVPPYDNEISALNHLADEYKAYVSPVVIRYDDLSKYKELFTKMEFQSLQDFILNKKDYQRNATSFPVILILDKNGNIKNAWSGDKTDDGLKREDFYRKIKTGLDAISKQN